MSRTLQQAVTILVPGVAVTSGAAAASVAIPNDASGNRAKCVKVQCLSGYVYVRQTLGATPACTTNDLAVISTAPPELLYVHGSDHISYLQGSTAAVLNIIPVEL